VVDSSTAPEILYEHGPTLVVNKPAGLPTQAPPRIESLEARLRWFLLNRDQKPGGVYLGIVHRLDRPASGVIVFARHKKAARLLSRQFERRQVSKRYWALVQGVVSPEEGTWEDHMRKVPEVAKSEIVPADHPESQHAALRYRTLGRTTHGSWLEIELLTGRTHQIRLQAASRGLPILGDELYGSNIPFGEQFSDVRRRAIALHARSLAFRDPTSQQDVLVTAEPHERWGEIVGSSRQ
jgi:23S rRNA pseudouridine1911/1915/1917 synthase